MFDVQTTKTVRKTRKKNLGSFLAMLFCTLVILSTMGNSFGIRNSYAQQQLQQLQTQQPSIVAYHSPFSNSYAQQQQPQTQQPSTVVLSPWSNKQLQATLLCGHGVCSSTVPTANSDNTQNNLSGKTQWHNNNIVSAFLSDSATDTKNLDLRHDAASNKVVGPDRFRFVTSYWTTPDTPNGVDVGTSSQFLAANSLPPNPKLEVDTNEGYSTLAVALQYQGVVQLDGIAAALKLPIGFKAIHPLTDDRTNFDIALSSYRGNIVPGQGIVLYFPMYVLPTAKVGLPVLGPVALHFLRADDRQIMDTINAPQQQSFSKALSLTRTTFPNQTNINENIIPQKENTASFQRDIPFDFINQIIPVTWHVTGQETLDVVTLPTLGKDAVKTISTNLVTIPNGKSTLVRLAVRNTGDAPVWDLTANVLPGLQSNLGINGLTPSAITSPNIPQTLFSTILPIGIAGPAFFGIGELGPNQNVEFDVTVFPTHYVAGTVELLNVRVVYNNIIGERVDTSVPSNAINPAPSICCQIYFNVAPNP